MLFVQTLAVFVVTNLLFESLSTVGYVVVSTCVIVSLLAAVRQNYKIIEKFESK